MLIITYHILRTSEGYKNWAAIAVTSATNRGSPAARRATAAVSIEPSAAAQPVAGPAPHPTDGTLIVSAMSDRTSQVNLDSASTSTAAEQTSGTKGPPIHTHSTPPHRTRGRACKCAVPGLVCHYKNSLLTQPAPVQTPSGASDCAQDFS
jgi:hypothetical protein